MLGQEYTILSALRLFRCWRFSFFVILRRVRQSFRPHYRAVIKSRPLVAGTIYFKLRICPTRSKKIFSQGRTSRPGSFEMNVIYLQNQEPSPWEIPFSFQAHFLYSFHIYVDGWRLIQCSPLHRIMAALKGMTPAGRCWQGLMLSSRTSLC
jgi:hypothetical protein